MYDEKANREYYLMNGRCPHCNGKRFVVPGRKKCAECLEADRAARRRRKEARIAAGVCTGCGRPRDDPRFRTCSRCRGRERPEKLEDAKRRYSERKEAGKCTACGVKWAEPGKTMCAECIEAAKARSRRNDPDGAKRRAWRQARVDAGRCIDCNRPTEDGRQRCRRCRGMRMDSTRKYRIHKRTLQAGTQWRCDW